MASTNGETNGTDKEQEPKYPDGALQMASTNGESSVTDKEKAPKYPGVAMYGACSVFGLKEGDVRLWCRCGLSQNQPWCDGSHKGTGFQPMKWVVPKTQTIYELCACKYTRDPPYCDAKHTKLASEVIKRTKKCSSTEEHVEECRLCTRCGWTPDF